MLIERWLHPGIHLNNHCVDLVWAELELVTGEGVSETELHGSHLLVRETWYRVAFNHRLSHSCKVGEI